MEELSPNPILEFKSKQLEEVRALFGYEDTNRLHQDIKAFELWIQKQQHFIVKDYDRSYLERQLVCSKGSIERAKKRLDKLCTLRGLMPEYLQGFDIKNEFNSLLNVTYTCIFPKPTPDNCRILFTNFHNSDPSLYESKYMSRYLLLIVEYLYSHDYHAGVEMVCDTRNVTLGVVAKINPITVGNTFMLMHEALGLRLKAIHFINGSKFLDTIMAILKTGLSKKLTSRIHIHDSYEALFNYIPRDVMSKDLGGDMPLTLKEINDNNFKEFSSPEFIKIMKYMECAATNETNRLNSNFNEVYSGMPGSFKVLSVD